MCGSVSKALYRDGSRQERLFYPKVDAVTCIDCGACEKVCPFQDGNIKLDTPLTAYAAWNKDREQYLASSSGGAAHVFSSHIIKRGGVVYGCTSEGMHIRHIHVDFCRNYRSYKVPNMCRVMSGGVQFGKS